MRKKNVTADACLRNASLAFADLAEAIDVIDAAQWDCKVGPNPAFDGVLSTLLQQISTTPVQTRADRLWLVRTLLRAEDHGWGAEDKAPLSRLLAEAHAQELA